MLVVCACGLYQVFSRKLITDLIVITDINNSFNRNRSRKKGLVGGKHIHANIRLNDALGTFCNIVLNYKKSEVEMHIALTVIQHRLHL